MMKIKSTLKILAATFATVLMLVGCASSVQTAPEPPLTYQVFYDKLSPYGTWIDYPGYGQVWSPDIRGEFRPYVTNGYWVATTAGWTWASNYRWGWAPFHYGRWVYENRFGWLWIPGYEWSPAWVVWGTVDEYYCWAPLMPEVDVTILFNTWSPAPFYWNLCPRQHITMAQLQPHVIRGDRARSGTRIVNIQNYDRTGTRNWYYAKGPAYDEVQRETGSIINPIRLEDVRNAPNRLTSDRARMYRPRIETPQTPQQGVSNPRPSVYRKGTATETPQNQVREPLEVQRAAQRTNINNLPKQRQSTRR